MEALWTAISAIIVMALGAVLSVMVMAKSR
jgi:heme/copper-type cytochrome/quinol oxidase subunit 2